MAGVPSVLLVVHPERPEALELGDEARAWWEERGFAVTSADDLAGDGLAGDVLAGEHAPCGPAPLPPDGRYELAVSLGGDGTMLRTVRLACAAKTPVLGVNLGRMGYLTEVEPGGMIAAFERIERGDYEVEERMTLDVSIRSPSTGQQVELLALNEATLERIAPGHTIRVAVDISGRRFLTYVADGLLVCTPTGSTAYNLSARGPVVSPRLQAMVLTAVAPHLAFDRSLVLGPSETVGFTLLPGRPATVVVDGHRLLPLEEGGTLTCRGGSEPARLIVFGKRDFHAVLRSRFGLTDR